jgi:hypothetical protein
MAKTILSLLRLPKPGDHSDFYFDVPELFERKKSLILLPQSHTLATPDPRQKAEVYLKSSRLLLLTSIYA